MVYYFTKEELAIKMTHGYIARDKSGIWHWFSKMPLMNVDFYCWDAQSESLSSSLQMFRIKGDKNLRWTQTLTKCGAKKNLGERFTNTKQD